MKVNSVKIQNYKLFKYNLLKLQIYSNKTFLSTSSLSEIALEQLEVYFKQVLKIIFEYHVNHFKILFIGFPFVAKLKQAKFVHFTNHNFILENSWVSGLFRNRLSILTYLNLMQSQKFSKNIKLLLSIKTKPHLVVIFDQKVEANVIQEFYKTGIPILSFNSNFLQTVTTVYSTFGNFNFDKKNIKMTCFFLLYSLLKKTPLSKKTQFQKLLKLKN